jgi:hypothetical protein
MGAMFMMFHTSGKRRLLLAACFAILLVAGVALLAALH